MKVIASSLRKGSVVDMDGKLYVVLTAENIHPGKGTPVTQLNMRRISDGVKIAERYRTTEQVERAFVDDRNHTFLYQDGEGFHFMNPENFDQLVASADVIGDAAVTVAVDAFEVLVERFGAPAVARCGHRLEHLEMVSAEQAAKLGAWGVTASMQPGFDALWGGRDGMYARRLGADRAAGLNPLSLLASAGVPLAFGSDTPVTCMDPWTWVHAASHHQTPGSAISVRAAFAAATRGAWRAGGVRDGITGTLVPGAPA